MRHNTQDDWKIMGGNGLTAVKFSAKWHGHCKAFVAVVMPKGAINAS